ncbi:hypothetical protein BDV96DRAFT_681665 [Lophiotrema nucula]|uniref:Uncharacterized protein n=1 Tax=Lophiotrema nucula TaxID=690887 RepID=A0A6A5ZXR3_9PLEO|nr:hypothetical protein BDV96DRAFT_681665 [Lophiotrema nucula]
MAQPSTFPTELPPRAQALPSGTLKDRNCPNMRSCWTISYHSYSLRTSDKAVLARRICMWIILATRTAVSILSIMWGAWGNMIVSVIIGTILALIGFFFIAWCLARIGDAEGSRTVLGCKVGRWHFDIFVLILAILHVGLLIGAFFGVQGGALEGTWLILWLLIFAVAWIATWAPDEPPSNV